MPLNLPVNDSLRPEIIRFQPLASFVDSTKLVEILVELHRWHTQLLASSVSLSDKLEYKLENLERWPDESLERRFKRCMFSLGFVMGESNEMINLLSEIINAGNVDAVIGRAEQLKISELRSIFKKSGDIELALGNAIHEDMLAMGSSRYNLC